MLRKDELSDGEFYHLYNRGNSRQPIFLDDQDRERFVKLLYICNSDKSVNFREEIIKKKIDAFDYDRGTPIVSIGAWVLMPNHFHLLLISSNKPKTVFGQNRISIFMKKLLTSYSKYFNKKYERSGVLFEGPFKNKRLNLDNYLKYTFSYIHLNPIKIIDKNWKDNKNKDIKKFIKYLEGYKWSSYSDYLNLGRVQEVILTKKDFPNYFYNKKIFNDEIFEWLDFDN